MDYVEGEAIEEVAKLDQQERNRVMTCLIELALRELFELRLIQSDPNFANYLYNSSNKKIVLLDFGASRKLKANFVNHYRQLAAAAIEGDGEKILSAAEKLGYQLNEASDDYQQLVLKLFLIALEPLREDIEYDFSNTDLANRLAELSNDVGDFKEFWQAPPTDILYLHRKIGGMFLMASKLNAQVNVYRLIKPWL